MAVCDTPAGKYEFLGVVKDKQGGIIGEREGDTIQFDPGVFIDDDGTIYLYSGNLTYLTCKYNSLYGTVESDWKKEEDCVTFMVKIPASTTAEIILPNGRKQKVISGEYSFQI